MRHATFVKRLTGPFQFLILKQAGATRIPHFTSAQHNFLIVLAIFILVIFCLRFSLRRSLPPEETFQEVAVEIQGDVRKPGVYVFRTPPTLNEVVEKAGGIKDLARLNEVQSPEALESGTLLRVSRESPKDVRITWGRMEARKLLAFSIPLDLNRASVEDLCLISGIGESLAREIVTYRDRGKGFRSVEELINVKGIEEKKYQSLKPFFTVRP